tara:strand:+ start:2913 stop:4091 length:1179 start_codon:yes stop_codon:yes gene_type:complete
LIRKTPEKNVDVSFVIPCLNEARTLKMVIERCHEAGGYIGSYEIVVADNMSKDNSVEIAINEKAKVIKVIEKGYGSALNAGIKKAKGTYVVIGDADNTYDFMDSIKMIKILKQFNCDLVIGNRFKGHIENGAMPFLHRYLGNPVLSALGRILYLVNINDFHCGIRAFNRKSIINLELKTTGMEFASEMIIRCSLANYKIKEIGVTLKRGMEGRIPHIKTWRDGWRHLKFLLTFSPKYSYFPISIIFITLAFFLFILYLRNYDPFAGTNTLMFIILLYNLSLWSFSEYLTFRLLISKNITYKTNTLSELLFNCISKYKYIDKAYQIIFGLIIASFAQFIFIIYMANNHVNFLQTKFGNLCSFNLVISSTTILFLYLTSSKLGTIYWLYKGKDK